VSATPVATKSAAVVVALPMSFAVSCASCSSAFSDGRGFCASVSFFFSCFSPTTSSFAFLADSSAWLLTSLALPFGSGVGVGAALCCCCCCFDLVFCGCCFVVVVFFVVVDVVVSSSALAVTLAIANAVASARETATCFLISM